MSELDQCNRIAELESQLSDIRELLTGSEQESPVALCRELLEHDTALVGEVERLKAERDAALADNAAMLLFVRDIAHGDYDCDTLESQAQQLADGKENRAVSLLGEMMLHLDACLWAWEHRCTDTETADEQMTLVAEFRTRAGPDLCNARPDGALLDRLKRYEEALRAMRNAFLPGTRSQDFGEGQEQQDNALALAAKALDGKDGNA